MNDFYIHLLPIRVLIADDAEAIRKCIRGLLGCEPTIDVCGEAASFSRTLELAATLKPDVILLDLHMPDGHRFESAVVKSQLLSTSQVLAISLSQQDGEAEILANGYGAAALLDKAKLFDELIPAIQRVNGEPGHPDKYGFTSNLASHQDSM
jgi:two-component system, NarL family, response regulator DevR